jgi:hypothetical protein
MYTLYESYKKCMFIIKLLGTGEKKRMTNLLRFYKEGNYIYSITTMVYRK